MKRILNVFAVFTILMVFLTGCDNFLNSNEDFNKLLETDIDYAKAPLVNVLVGHNNDDFGTVGTGVVNYSVTAKVGYAFEVTFALKASAGNFVGWNAYTKYDPDIPANCKLLDESYIEFVDNSRGKLNAKVKILKEINEQIRLVPEVTAFPVMEVCLPSELTGISPSPATFNPPQVVKALTPGQEYSITATTTVDYGFSENPDECWKVYRKDSLGNEIEIADGANISIGKNTGTQLANGRSQSTIYITVDEEFSGRFYVSPKLITYPSMKVEIENFDSSLVKMSHSGTVPMAKGTPYEISLQTDSSVGFSGWKLCKRDNITLEETEELIPADNKTTTSINLFTAYSDDYITVSSPSYEVSETGKTAGKVNASIRVTLKQDMDDLDYSYYLLPQFFRYPVVNVLSPEGYASAGRFSLIGAGYLDNDVVRMMMDDYEYTITYKTTEDYSFAEPNWIVYESSDPSRNLLDAEDSRIEVLVSSVVLDESGSSSGSISITLNHNFGTNLYIKPVVSQKPSMNISFEEGTSNGINLSLGGSTITSGSINSKIIKMSTGKTYTATVNIPKGYSFEGWRLVRETSSTNKMIWITESTKTTTDIVESATIDFDSGVSSENPGDYVRLFNAKYTFENEGRNAGTTKATVDISFKKQLSDFSLNLVPVIKSVPEISFVAVNSDYGALSPSASDVRNLYPETKIDLTFKSTKQATAGKEIWKIKKWDSASGAYSIDYSANVGYTSLDLTAALKDPVLSSKEIIIYSNDNEAEVQPNSKGEYITTKTAVLYVNRMPDANLQLYVEPEVYNTIKFVPGTNFESTAFDSEVYIPAHVTFNFELKTKAGYKFSSLGTPANGTYTTVEKKSEATSYDGVSTVTGTIISDKNNGDTVVVTPEASQIYKLCFGKPVLSTLTDEEYAGTMIPADTDFIYQVAGNSTSIRFETTGEYTFEGFGAISEKRTNFLNDFYDIDNPNARGKYYVFTSGTLAQAKEKIPSAKLIIHDLVETDLTDSQGQAKKRVTGTLTIVKELTSNFTIKPVVKAKPSFAVNLDNAEKGSVSPSTAKAILINEDYSISYISSSGYGFEKWSVTENGTSDVPVLTLTEAAGAAGTSATSFVVDLGSVQELTGNNSLSNIQTALGSNRAKLLAVIYNSDKVESQATEGVETATAKFRIVQDIASAIAVSPVTYQHSYFYVANNANATVTPASTSKAMVKKGRDYDFRIVTNTNYMYSTLSFSGATVANAGSTINPTFSSYTTQDAVCYNLVPTVNKETGVVTVTGKLRMLKEAEKTIVITPVINTFPKITLSEETSGDTTRLTLGNNTVSGGSVTASMISDYEKSGTTYVTKYIDYDIEAVPSDSKGAYKYSSQSMFKVYNPTGTRLTTGLQITESTTCPAFNSNSNLIIYDCHLVSMENGNYKAVAKIRVKSGTYTIKPGIYTQPKIAIQSFNAGDITSITFNGQRTSSDSISAQTLYTNCGQPRNYEFSIKLKEGFAVYTENAESPEDSDPNPAGVSLKAYSPANEELSCGYNGDYNLYNKNGDADEETPTIIHEIEQNYDGTNYVLTGKIRSFEGANIVLKPNVYKVPVINIDQPYFEEDDTTPGTLKINNITQAQAYSSPSLLSTKLNFIYTASTGYYLKEFKVYDSAGTLKSTYSVGPSSITAGTSVSGLSFSNLTVATAARKRISGTLTVTAPSVDGYKIVPEYVKGSLGPTLKSCSLSYYPVKYTNTSNSDSTAVNLTNSTVTATTISTDATLSLATNGNYYKDNTPLPAGGTQIASNGAKYISASLKNVFTGATGANSFSVILKATNANFPGDTSYIPVKIKVTEKLVGLYPNMYYMTERDEKTTVRVTANTKFDSDLIPEIYNCAKTSIKTSQTTTTDANFTRTTTVENGVTTATFNFGLNFNIPYGGIHQFEISAIDSKGNETEKRTICLEYPRPVFSDTDQGTKLKNPVALRKAGGTTVYVRYTNKPTSDTYPYIAYYSTTTGKCHFTKPSFLTNGFDETISILKRSTSSQSACIRLANTAGFFSLSSKESSSMTTSIAGPGDIVYRKLNSDKKYVCPLDDYLANPSIGEPIAVIVSGTGSSSDTKTIGNRILGMGLKVPTQDYYYPGKLKFFNDITETLGTGTNARSYQVASLIKSSVSSVKCGTNDGQGKNNLTDFQSVAFNKMTTADGATVPYAITGSSARPSSSQSFPVFSYAAHYAGIELNGFGGENWYIPSVAEMKFVQDELSMITNVLKTLNVTPLNEAETCWTSTFDTTSTATNPREVYTYPLNMGSYYTGRSVDPIIVNYTTVSPAYAVRVFYDFTDELEVE